MTRPQTRTRGRRGRRLLASLAETFRRRTARSRTAQAGTPGGCSAAAGWRPGRDTEPATYVITCTPGKPCVITCEPADRDLEAGQ
jgi:hypothetical protein